MRNLKKKGFTIVELVIVIAVIAVLAAVLIPTFVNLTRKANVSADTVLVKNLNTSLSSDAKEHKTMHDALEAAKANGYDIAKIQTKANGNKILWDSKNDCFVYLDSDKDKIVYIPDTKSVDVENKDLWTISNEVSDTYSTYLYGYEETEVIAKFGLDTGDSSVAQVVLNTDAAGELTIRTNGGVLKLDAANATVNHYGSASEVYVINVADSTYNLYGNVGYIEVENNEHVVLKQGSSVSAVYAPGNNVELENGQEDVVYTSGAKEEIKESATKFAGGLGTEENPYLITNVEQFKNIDSLYEKGFYSFKIADGIDALDLTGWESVRLNGNFDGNGVKFTNVTACLFKTVGYQLQNENIVLKDFDATMNVSANGEYGSAALIKNIFNAGVTTFDNVKVHGYLEGYWNMGSFYNYGTANYDDIGCDYEVVFNDCYSDATLVCASGNTIGGLFGHAFEGSGNSFTLRVNNTEYVGQMFLTTSSGKGNKYFGMTSDYYNTNNHFYFDGVEDTFDNGNIKNAGAYTNSTKITKVVATKESNGYVVAKQNNVSKIVVTITAQLTAYDANGVKISNLSGITMTLSSTELTELDGSNIKVLDLFNSIDITKNASEYGVGVNNNTLNIRLSSSANYQSGNIRLQVNQYDSTGSIVSAGTIDLATSADANSEWIVK